MNTFVKSHYRRFRAAGIGGIVGQDAVACLHAARTLDRWNDLENDGLVQLEAIPDDSYNYHDFDGADKCSKEHPCSECRAIERGDGPCFVQGGYRLDSDDRDGWVDVDSISGNVGYNNVLSPFENSYVIDIMYATLKAFEAARLAGFGDVSLAASDGEGIPEDPADENDQYEDQ